MEDLVLLTTDRPLSPAEQQTLFRCLDAETRERVNRSTVASVRQQRLLASALAREMCARRLGRAPASLRVAVAPGGKPFLPDHPALHFNVSHTSGGVLCGVSDRPVGVDIERERPFPERVARRCFSPAELTLTGDDPACRLRLWTRKEAAAKWRGEGLAAVRALDTTAPEWRDRLFSDRIGAFVFTICEAGVQPAKPVCRTLDQFMEAIV